MAAMVSGDRIIMDIMDIMADTGVIIMPGVIHIVIMVFIIHIMETTAILIMATHTMDILITDIRITDLEIMAQQPITADDETQIIIVLQTKDEIVPLLEIIPDVITVLTAVPNQQEEITSARTRTPVGTIQQSGIQAITQ